MAKRSAPKKAAKAKKAAPKKSSTKKAAKKASPKKWSKKVSETSNAMDLEKDIFKQNDPKKIAASVKRSAEKSKRKSRPFSICYEHDQFL